MKQYKPLLITAAGLCGAGILVAGAAFCMTGFRFSGLSTITHEERKTVIVESADMSSLSLDVSNQPVEVIPSADGKTRIHYVERDRDQYDFEDLGGAVRFTHSIEGSVVNNPFTDGLFSGFFLLGRKVVIELPADTGAVLDLRTTNSSMKVSDLRTSGNVALKTTNGAIRVVDVECAGSLSAVTTNSSITLRQVTGNGVSLESTNGSLSLEDVKSGSALSGGTTNGSISVRDASCEKALFVTDNGSIHLDRLSAAVQMEARTKNASIHTDVLKSPIIRLFSTNGSLKGTLAGRQEDYYIDTSTTNSTSNLGTNLNDTLPGRLEARTTNGSIRLEFTG